MQLAAHKTKLILNNIKLFELTVEIIIHFGTDFNPPRKEKFW